MKNPRKSKHSDRRHLFSPFTRREFLRLGVHTSLVSVTPLLAMCQSNPVEGCDTAASAVSSGPLALDADLRNKQAYLYLQAEMDRWVQGTVVYDDQDSGGAGFFPSNKMGDIADIQLDPASMESPAGGTTCLKFTYTPRGSQRWAGIYFTYPDLPPEGNWGSHPGRDVTGATQLSGLIRGETGREIVELKIGGINRPPHHDPAKPYQDAFGPLTPTEHVRITLTREWQHFSIPIPLDTNLKSVIGGFALVVSRSFNPTGCTLYLDNVSYDNADPNQLRLVRSYLPTAHDDDKVFRNAAFLYDNALTLLAFLARNDAEGQRRAALLADSLVWAQTHDRIHDDGARWRNAYSCGPLEDPATETARLPGWYDTGSGQWAEDRYAVSSDVGNAAWTCISLLAAHTSLRPDHTRYLSAALRTGQWIAENFRVNDALGGYMGGFEGLDPHEVDNPDGPCKVKWRSMEHNIDLYVAFLQLAAATGDETWKEHALHARQFCLQMWNPEKQHFWTGVRDLQGTLNTDAIPSDPQTWAVLAMGHDTQFRQTIGWAGPPAVPTCISWVEQACRVESPVGCPGVGGYRFSDKGTGVWFEGSAHLAAAYHYIGDISHAQAILQEIMHANPVGGAATSGTPGVGGLPSPGGIFAACPHPAETGFLKEFAPGVVGKWTYPRRLHIGATAWFGLAMRGVNPYWLNGSPRPTA